LSENISNIARYVFLLAFIVDLIFGVWYFISPESWTALTGWPTETASGRMLGVAGVIGMIWNYATMTLPVAGWFMTGLLALFLILFGYVYYQAKQT
jgi:hypothetical protein